ncbi:MAG: hypothetical protein ACJ8J0_00880 [Longimicrobiaceae bacterium]
MTLLLLAALLATAMGLLVIGPILARRTAVLADAAPGSLLDAEARRRAALAALKDLEYDYLGGKLDAADYQAQRARLGHEAVAAMRAAEAAQAEAGAGVVDGTVGTYPPVTHGCGFVNPPGSRFCAGCGKRLR